MMLRLWVDDERPAPKGWVWSKTVANTIDTLILGDVEEMSLDYVLGRGQNGGQVLEWLREHPDRWPPVIHTHSSSLDACELMQTMVREWAPNPT
jgi:hypothetical protein